MQNDFNKGASYMRDIVISGIIGIQNEQGNREETEEYKVLQSLLLTIEKYYGEYGKDFKG